MNDFNKRFKLSPTGHDLDSDSSDSVPESKILNEEILVLVFGHMKWDLRTLCATAQVSRKLRAVAKRILWRALCSYKAPRMVGALSYGLPGSRIGGGWHALAKLMFFCCGCQPSSNHRVKVPLSGHLVKESRFSKTSGLSFLTRRCRRDLLYVSDPCEHHMGGGRDDLGIFRGVFRGFMRSKTRACLIGRQVELEEHVRCPYCGARVWSMTSAKLVPKSAAKRLGTQHGDELDYFVCINGHLHGACWLVPLTSDDEGKDDDNYDDDDDDDSYDYEEMNNDVDGHHHIYNLGLGPADGNDLSRLLMESPSSI